MLEVPAKAITEGKETRQPDWKGRSNLNLKKKFKDNMIWSIENTKESREKLFELLKLFSNAARRLIYKKYILLYISNEHSENEMKTFIYNTALFIQRNKIFRNNLIVVV